MASENVLSYYWELASSSEANRIKAAGGLVKTLIESQDKHVQEHKSDALCTDLDYSIKRLCKGLASSRKGARQGFATVLTEVLHQFNCISTEDVMKLLQEQLHVTGSAKSQEERDAFIGHIFGLMSVVRSQNLSTETKADECDWLKEVISSLKQLSEKKTYLREICMKSIADVICMISSEVFKQFLLPVVKDFVYGGWPTSTPESLLIALCVQQRFKKSLDMKTFKKAWNSANILDEQNYSRLSYTLQESTCVHPNVHCVWEEVFAQIFQENPVCFEGFWRVVVDDGLFQSTFDRKYLGFSLIAKILPQIYPDQVTMVFGKNVTRSFMSNLSSNQSYLHNAAKHLSLSMPNALAENKNPDVTFAVIKQLLGGQGSLLFDRLTKTKTVDSLLEKVEGSGLEKLISWFVECFKNGDMGHTKEEMLSLKEVDDTRKGILNQILIVNKKKKNFDQSSAWRKKLLFFLIETTYFESVDDTAEGKKLISLSTQLREVCEQRFFSVIKDLGTPQWRQQKDSKTTASDQAADKQYWMFTIITHLKELLASDSYTAVSSRSWTEDTKKTFAKSVKLITKIHKKHKECTITVEDKAFELLMSHIVLQLFTEAKEATEILKELKSCYKNRKEKEKGQDSKDEPHWVEVLTEILLSLLVRPSNLLRHVADDVFTAIVSHLNQAALGSIIKAIDPKGIGEDDDENLEEIDDSDDEDLDSEDVAQENHESEEEDIEEDNESSEEGEDDDNNEVDEAFRAEIKAALGSASLPDNEEQKSVDEAEDLDDESMMQLDSALAAVFKSKAQDKKKKKEKSRTILHFKLRVLDIIEIFIKKQPTNPLVLDLVDPLLSLVRKTLNVKDYQTLGERAQGIFKNKLCVIKEPPSLVDINAQDIHSRLEKLIRQAMSAPSLNFVTLLTRGCMFMIRVLRGKAQAQPQPQPRPQPQFGSPTKKRKHDKNLPKHEHVGLLDVPKVVNLFKEALKDFMERRSTHLHSVLFMELIKRFPFLGWELAPDLAKNINSAVNNYRKSQACIMLTLLVAQKTSSYEENLKKLAPSVQTSFNLILEESAKPDTTLKVKHFREVLKLMNKLYKEFGVINQEEKVIDLSSVGKGLQDAAEGVLAKRSQDIKTTCTRLLTLSKGSSGTVSSIQPKKKLKESQQNGSQSSDSTHSSPKQKEKKRKRIDEKIV